MTAYIYIHSFDSIVEKFVVDFDDFSELLHYYESARMIYGQNESFCFDVMII